MNLFCLKSRVPLLSALLLVTSTLSGCTATDGLSVRIVADSSQKLAFEVPVEVLVRSVFIGLDGRELVSINSSIVCTERPLDDDIHLNGIFEMEDYCAREADIDVYIFAAQRTEEGSGYPRVSCEEGDRFLPRTTVPDDAVPLFSDTIVFESQELSSRHPLNPFSPQCLYNAYRSIDLDADGAL